LQDHLDLRKILGKTEGKWLLTYNDHLAIRRLYEGFYVRKVSQTLTASKTKSGGSRSSFTNLIITNYEV